MSMFKIGNFLPSYARLLERAEPAPRPAPAKQSRAHDHSPDGFDCPKTSEGRHQAGGTADDSIGRNKGTPDDSIGRNKGTPDDSIGRNKGTPDDSIGRDGGTPDDSIGRDKGTPDDSIGGVTPPPTRQTDGERPNWLANRLPINRDGISATGNARIDECLEGDDPQKAAAAAYAFSTPAFAALAAPEREKFIELATRTDAEGTKVLARLAEKSGDALFQTATDGTSTLDNLVKLAKSDRAELFLNTALKDIANPDRIMQGEAPTCTVTSMQYELANDRPAEYARLIAGLAIDGKVTMAGGGELEGRPAATVRRSEGNRDQRSPTEAIFQDAAMEFANGADTYSLTEQRSTGVHDGKEVSYRGLHPEQIRAMIGQLFGTSYETREVKDDQQAVAELARLPTTAQPNRPLFFDIDFGSFNHNVALVGVKDGMVLYHDPYTGKNEQMPTAEFIKRVTAVHVPQLEEVAPPKFLDLNSFMRNVASSERMVMVD